jgi:signal transduction histidine kinase/Pyruvate/2-oxoacid:ferredoxin oxidoreductase delta subunit
MKPSRRFYLVYTLPERCRLCFTCVRECPAKAIKVAGGQAVVVPERCIGCGNCVQVCSQKAKRVFSEQKLVDDLLANGKRTAALVAPSFPAEFPDMKPSKVVGLLRRMGFSHVYEVAFGADLVARRYSRLLEDNPGKRFIGTTCPAIVAFVEKYHPEALDALSPLVSPMVAMARVVRRIHENDVNVVFIGPCIAKKSEALSKNLPPDVDAVLTFAELRSMLKAKEIEVAGTEESDFDPPHGGLGALFPLSRGMLQAADIKEDLVNGDVVAAGGRHSFQEALKEFASGDLDARLLEVLCCDGCIMGSGMTTKAPQFRRRSRVSQVVRQMQRKRSRIEWEKAMATYRELDLSRGFSADDQRIPVAGEERIREFLKRMGKRSSRDELNCGACGYETCREHAVAVLKGLADNEMCLPYMIDELRKTVSQLADSHEKLASTQEALMHSERLASMGQLAAGIAHEVNNPLGVVLMYAHLLLEDTQNKPQMSEDLRTIAEQADRCKNIVSGLLNFARQNKVVRQPVLTSELFEASLKAVPKPDNIEVKEVHLNGDVACELDKEQIIQVITNLISNAYAAMPEGGTLTLRTHGDEDSVSIEVEDTGTGIPEGNLKKIFEPFFTTKQPGKGTGLGLSVSYGIIKMHRGNISVKSNADRGKGPTGSVFTVTLPLSVSQ